MCFLDRLCLIGVFRHCVPRLFVLLSRNKSAKNSPLNFGCRATPKAPLSEVPKAVAAYFSFSLLNLVPLPQYFSTLGCSMPLGFMVVEQRCRIAGFTLTLTYITAKTAVVKPESSFVILQVFTELLQIRNCS